MFINTNFFRILSTFVIAGALLSLTGTNAYASSSSAGPIIDYEYGYGPIASINNDWVLAGNYMGYGNPSNLSDSGFHATFSMVMKNGSAPHMHQISNATLSDVRMDGNNTIMQGSVTVTLKDGPVFNVPTNWTINNNNTIAISMDPSKTNNHFGDTPIYGLELTPEKETQLMNTAMKDSKFMDKWIPLMIQNVMKSSELNGKNMSIIPMSNDSMRTDSVELIGNTSGINN